jgi:hypothetical protein
MNAKEVRMALDARPKAETPAAAPAGDRSQL